MKKNLCCIFSSFILTGCASDIVPMGPDTYMMSDTGPWSWSSGGNLKAEIYKDAYAFCRKQGKEMMPVKTSQTDANFSTFARAEVQFRCLTEGDSELQRPTMESVPSVIIHTK